MSKTNYLFDSRDKNIQHSLNRKLYELIKKTEKPYERIAVVCIGTDSCTGDCFGPLVGYLLSKWTFCDFDLYGTIHEPVHAKNLEDTLKLIDTDKTLVIAVDSSLGVHSHVGSISIGNSPIIPGSSLGKDLPGVGDIHIAGIVNIGGYFPMVVLQNTRLGLVYTMSEIASRAIKYALYRLKYENITRKFKVMT